MRNMRDSGVEWIGEIPCEWKVSATKHLFSIYSGATPKSEYDENWDGNIVWITPADYKTADVYVSSGRRNLSEKGLGSCSATLIPANSLIFSKRAPIGAVAINSRELCTNQGCISCVVKEANDDVVKFYYYVMSIATEYYELLGSGTTFKEISATNFSNFVLPHPSAEIQQRITALLDEKCSHVDTLITNVQAQIEKLKTYKQSVITEVVTKGLDSSVPMKDSEVEWIGEIPQSWTTIRVKQLLKERRERSVDGLEEPLSMSQKLGLVPTSMLDTIPNMASSFVGAKLAYVDDLVFNKLKAHLGVFSVSKYDGLVSPDYAVYYSTGKVHLKYLEYLFKTPQCISEFRKRSTGIAAGLTRLYTDGLFAIECPFPSMEDQIAIVEFLNTKCEQIDQLIAIKQKKIDKLNEYKKSLIYEYVTGKKEVS